MPDLSEHFLQQIYAHQMSGIPAGERSVFPAYDGFSNANLPASICQRLDIPAPSNGSLDGAYLAPFQKRYRQVVLLLVDGLGLTLFRQHAGEEPWKTWIEAGSLAALTSISPSTTASALTTFWSGVYPAQHGIMGYEVWLKEYGLIANMILHAPSTFGNDPNGLARAGFDPATFLPVPTLGKHLSANHIDTGIFQPAHITHSGLSSMLFAGQKQTPYRTAADLVISLGGKIRQPGTANRYLYAYWSNIDDLSHRFGPDDERIHLEFYAFSQMLERVLEPLRQKGQGDTLFLVTADHGLLDTPPDPRYDLHSYPLLQADLTMSPSGENRLAYCYLRPGHEAHFRDSVERYWPGEFAIVEADKALQAGLFGPGKPYEGTSRRIGDLILIARENGYLWWPEKENEMRGRHGGLSPEEMLVPLLAFEI